MRIGKSKGHFTPSLKFSRAFFRFSTDAKTQKIEPDPIFFMTDESFGGSV